MCEAEIREAEGGTDTTGGLSGHCRTWALVHREEAAAWLVPSAAVVKPEVRHTRTALAVRRTDSGAVRGAPETR